MPAKSKMAQIESNLKDPSKNCIILLVERSGKKGFLCNVFFSKFLNKHFIVQLNK